MRLSDFNQKGCDSGFVLHAIKEGSRIRMLSGLLDDFPAVLELSLGQWIELFNSLKDHGCSMSNVLDGEDNPLCISVQTCAGCIDCVPDVPGWGSNGLVKNNNDFGGTASTLPAVVSAPKRRGRKPNA